jgi:uncharacterized protein (DUF433 family)
VAKTKTKLDDDRLIAEHVDASWGRSRARLRSGVPIWSLVGYLRVYDGDAEQVRQAFELSADEMAAALAYYHRNQQYVDAFLLVNSDD